MSAASPRGPATEPGTPSLDKDPRRIAGMFDAIAHRYDQLNHLLSAGFDRRWRRRAVAALDLGDGALVLDVCTGTADLAMTASRHQPAPRAVLGVDFAGAMLALGHEKLRSAGLSPIVRLVRGDACRLPCPSETVDAVTVGFGIRNVADTARAVEEMFRVLKPGGRLAILEFGEPRVPVLRSLYLWYFQRVLPFIGRRLSKHAEAYAYLPASVSAFLSPDALADLLRTSGFFGVRVDRLTAGVVYLYVGQKPVDT
ncbi:MAG: bifunctional demethylmenaquinone methyltransferase/2-methoxy-6-polyprenyl-1,4-benzoquinol methylase UbiE [Acidobacteria bacterium]|jgi:demethylmenaquinone methyltransferase/2-methoxy-6-polyprenyl-1,4-benzoquinol methylase|nr:bifunctional demethylmenaquinone methyltransferase/2-methoxy-6-polyprenyl-1,4-benzoquinol methylase UbiE [Acidobacteriota bacterium]MDP7480836.1 bifunctional demethylmenaquinone methyltransferase/2-methoxy-6-polyprenyl-1,4-benzoquinol methylase UbiE [Vicinamibacterales bacterium]MDP7691893.1 bifunctional demethylmenaquinone methyltransferase/2-methoxy-6-polyprenyl-1,4-benzoquinol methylase UbiE [Vicinamibacterales bacterium]HJN43670.1 bifunctional demethylmenaquinone methyltransferase/2-metho|tara:strand:- start:54 stop:818 length:765 start_codon:yes stop_codon:yes gene_type:complete